MPCGASTPGASGCSLVWLSFSSASASLLSQMAAAISSLPYFAEIWDRVSQTRHPCWDVLFRSLISCKVRFVSSCQRRLTRHLGVFAAWHCLGAQSVVATKLRPNTCIRFTYIYIILYQILYYIILYYVILYYVILCYIILYMHICIIMHILFYVLLICFF